MIALRILGVAGGLLLLAIACWRFQRGQTRRLDFFISLAIAASLIVIGVYPASVSPILETLNFREGDSGRLIGLLVISNLLLFFLFLHASATATTANQDISRLVRTLAQREFRKEAGRPSEPIDIAVVIAAYNEEASVDEVLDRLPREVAGLKVQPLVIVDGATDHTEEEVRKRGVPIVHAINRGQGAALLTGYEVMADWGAKIVIVTDADGQVVPEELPRLVEPIINERADFVHGSRFLGSYDNYSLLRPLSVMACSWLLSVLLRHRVTDFATPFKAFRIDALRKFRLHQEQFQASELLIEAFRHKLRYAEVPITMRRRTAGKSKKPSLPRYGLGVAKAIIQTWLR